MQNQSAVLAELRSLLDRVHTEASPGPWRSGAVIHHPGDRCKRDIVDAAQAELHHVAGQGGAPGADLLIVLYACIDEHLAGDADYTLFADLLRATATVRTRAGR